jgi:GNAT superfamily N-acetyltransferase
MRRPGKLAMSIKYRKFEPEDRTPVYRMFRESLWDYRLKHGLADPENENAIDEDFRQQRSLYLHLEKTASEDWVAENDSGVPVGWARSIERDNHLQLTHFFVDPDVQGGGVGRALLNRAFPLNRGDQRSIIATTNVRALSLYLRQGVSFQGMAFSLYGEPQIRVFDSILDVEQAEASPETLESILAIDSRVLGYRRPVDLEFFMNQQPTFLFHHTGHLVAYAFGCDGYSAGPAATLEPEYLPEVLHQIESSACHAGMDSLWLTVPAPARQAVTWALSSGYKIDPFHEVLLAREPTMKLDRFIMTQSAFIW